jgi:hypothetical protein
MIFIHMIPVAIDWNGPDGLQTIMIQEPRRPPMKSRPGAITITQSVPERPAIID